MGYALPPPSDPSLFLLLGLTDHLEQREADVRDLEELRRCVETFRPEVVFHLAAQSLVLESYRDPVATLATNVMGTVNVLEAVRSSPEVLACVVVTSDKCYETDGSGRPHREGDPMGGIDPYSASKGCAEIVTAAYTRSLLKDHQCRVVSVRAGNVIGGGDWSTDRLVPDIVRSVTTGSEIVLRRPDAVRPWQHVLEPIAGYLTLAEQLTSNPALEGGWNFGRERQDRSVGLPRDPNPCARQREGACETRLEPPLGRPRGDRPHGEVVSRAVRGRSKRLCPRGIGPRRIRGRDCFARR